MCATKRLFFAVGNSLMDAHSLMGHIVRLENDTDSRKDEWISDRIIGICHVRSEGEPIRENYMNKKL